MNSPSTSPILELKQVVRTYVQADNRLDILKGVNLHVHAGELVALVGPSGAGKSTLLHVAGVLEKPTQGQVRVEGQDVAHLSDRERTLLRRKSIGFVYQFHHLLPEFSALENIVIPQLMSGISPHEAQNRAMSLLSSVSLDQRASHRPARLSGGEQQRVAIARALANTPRILIADEPTGNLDHATSLHVFDMLTQLVRAQKVGALIATHNLELAAKMDRVLEIRDGLLWPQR